MQYIRKYKWLLAVPVICVLISSCKKQLEEKPYSFLSPANFYKNEEDAKTAINGVYSALYTWELYLQPIWNLTMLDDDHVQVPIGSSEQQAPATRKGTGVWMAHG